MSLHALAQGLLVFEGAPEDSIKHSLVLEQVSPIKGHFSEEGLQGASLQAAKAPFILAVFWLAQQRSETDLGTAKA